MAQRFKVGDRVMWKADIEEYGVVTRLYATAVDVDVWDGDRGENVRQHIPLCKLDLDE